MCIHLFKVNPNTLSLSLSLRYGNTILSLKPRRVTRVVSAGGPGVGAARVGVRERERERETVKGAEL